MDIDLYIDSILINNSQSKLNKLYCKINNDNERTLDLYSNVNYTFNFKSNNFTSISSSLKLSNYYIAFFYDFNYNTDTQLDNHNTQSDDNKILLESIIFYKGVNNLIINTEDNLETQISFKKNDINYNYTYIIYKIDTDNVYKTFLVGKLKVHEPLVFIKFNISNNKLIHDESNESNKYLINININKNIDANNVDIILYENYNYIFETYELTNKLFFNIYLNLNINYNLITINNSEYSQLYIKNIPSSDKNKKYVWSISQSDNNLYSGKLSFVNINKNSSNDEKLYDYKFKNVDILNRVLYNDFIYKENLNIKNLNNNINNLLITDSHKLLVINNINKINISIILPSTNIYLGLTYNILINNNLNSLNIYCEDKDNTLNNYDKLKGSIFLINSDNLLYKCILSNSEKLNDIETETNLSQNLIIKKIRLNNGNTYDGGLNNYGYIKIICSEYINNNYIWNIESKLIGNSILYTNTYLYNSFI